MKTVVGIKKVNERFNYWSVSFNGRVPGDSAKDSEARTLQEARNLVSADPEFRELDPALT